MSERKDLRKLADDFLELVKSEACRLHKLQGEVIKKTGLFIASTLTKKDYDEAVDKIAKEMMRSFVPEYRHKDKRTRELVRMGLAIPWEIGLMSEVVFNIELVRQSSEIHGDRSWNDLFRPMIMELIGVSEAQKEIQAADSRKDLS